MDVANIQIGSITRDRIAAYRDENDHPNYDEALQAMLDEVGYGVED